MLLFKIAKSITQSQFYFFKCKFLIEKEVNKWCLEIKINSRYLNYKHVKKKLIKKKKNVFY